MSVLLILASLLRLVRLSDSFWLDEAAQVLESSRPLAEQLQIAGDFQPPLMHLLTFFWLKFLGLFGLERVEALVRFLPSLIPGVLSVWASYQIALKFWPTAKNSSITSTKKHNIAFFTALLLAISPLHVYFSQELRPYSLAMMWACLSLLSLLNLSTPVKNTKDRSFFQRHGLTFIIFNILGLYSSYLYPFFLLAQLAYLLLIQKIALKKLLLPSALIGLAFLPWLPQFWEQLTVGHKLRSQMPGWAEVVSLPQIKSLPLVLLKFIYGPLDLKLNLFFIVTALLVFGLLIYLLYQQWQDKNIRAVLTFFLYFFLLPLLLIWLFSFFIPVLQPKRVLFLLPAFYLLLSYLLVQAKKRLLLPAKILFFIIAVIQLFSLFSYWLTPTLQRENWRSLVANLENNFGTSRAVAVFAFPAPFAPFEYYSQGQLATFATGSFYLPNETDLLQKTKPLADYDYILLFDYLRDLTDPQNQLPTLIRNLAFAEIGVFDYPNIGFVKIYSKQNLRAYENRF